MMKRRQWIKLCLAAGFAIAALLLSGSRSRVAGFSGGPDPGRTGAPGELTCATGECHGTARVTDPARFSIVAPREYVPGRTYRIEVRHQTMDASRLRWGFQLTALTTTRQRAGAWRAIDELTAVVEDTFPDFRRQYIQHTFGGTFRGQAGGASWTVEWTAPTADVGPITFYAAGNQADNNDNNTGDLIFLAQASSVPGASPPPAPPSGGLPGSLLVYPLYTSSAISRHTQNTRISLTNTHETQSVTAHLYFVDGDSGAIDHGFVLLGRQQTISILASDLDPATTGYLFALAVDDATGRPRPFNHLLGDSHIKLASGMAANLIAEAFQMNAPAVSGPANAPLAELRLDGEQYSAAPRTLSLASLSSPADGVETLLILNRLGGDATTALGAGLGTLYDGRGGAYGFSFTHAQPQLRALLTPAFVATTPALDAALPAGRTGWLKFQLQEDAGILGAAIRLDRRTGLRSQGRGLAHATLTRNATLTLPVFPPA